jgi:hypothetical protein
LTGSHARAGHEAGARRVAVRAAAQRLSPLRRPLRGRVAPPRPEKARRRDNSLPAQRTGRPDVLCILATPREQGHTLR